ncbi:hypothetical protein DM01DRAFT_1122141 [Hesseltinella vesiculosa]|uniref:Uncharacterized protein n=1 Tax=Hesseltinella vesiculosa TaxID=101127 RepID=A0A1X2GTT4_9FUNG|nr:hypothetical protein DM01DRAFT_1122141 [Hesseltinella vesiculosa]
MKKIRLAQRAHSFIFIFLANSNMMQPFNEPDLLGPSRLDMDRRFSIETPPFNNWRPNGWPASSLLPDANRFGDNMTQTDRHAQLVERAKVAYQKLDEITQAKYFLGGASSTQHTLTQLHRMMSDLYFDTTVDTRELYDVLAQSSMFQCIQHPQQGILVRLEIPTSSAPDDPLRRTSLLQSALHPSAPVHSPASHPSLSNASMLPQTSSPPFSFQPSLSTSLNYSFKNDR